MDALLTNTQTVAGSYPFWDFQVVGNIVPIITGSEETSQCAAVAAYTQANLIPQLPNVGINWTGLLTGTDDINSVDSQISQSLQKSNLPYKQQYSTNGRALVVNIVHQ